MYRFNIYFFIVSEIFLCFKYKKDLHTVIVHFGFLKWMHHSCHGYGMKMVTSKKYFFQCTIYHIWLDLTKVCKPFQIIPTCNNMLSRMSKTAIFQYIVTPPTFLRHCYKTELPKLLTIPSLYSHGAILPSTSSPKVIIFNSKSCIWQCMSILTDYPALFCQKFDASFTPL